MFPPRLDTLPCLKLEFELHRGGLRFYSDASFHAPVAWENICRLEWRMGIVLIGSACLSWPCKWELFSLHMNKTLAMTNSMTHSEIETPVVAIIVTLSGGWWWAFFIQSTKKIELMLFLRQSEGLLYLVKYKHLHRHQDASMTLNTHFPLFFIFILAGKQCFVLPFSCLWKVQH